MKDSHKQKKKKTNPNFILQHLPLIVLVLIAGNIILFVGVIIIGFVTQQTYSTSIFNTNIPAGFVKKLLPVESFQDISVGAHAMVIYDASEKAIIYGKNQNLRFSPASTAKIMTATVALQHYPTNTEFLVPQEIYLVEGSKMRLIPGEVITLENLLYGLMLPSGNDAAYVLAQAYPGGRGAFINDMNKKAQSLKLSGTHFVDPAGFEDGNYTTAFDLARLTTYALQNKTFSRVVSTQNILVYDKTKTILHVLKNINELLAIPGVTGVKTGYTNEAKGVLVTSFETAGQRYIIVVLGSENRFGDTEEVIERILTTLKNPQ